MISPVQVDVLYFRSQSGHQSAAKYSPTTFFEASKADSKEGYFVVNDIPETFIDNDANTKQDRLTARRNFIPMFCRCV